MACGAAAVVARGVVGWSPPADPQFSSGFRGARWVNAARYNLWPGEHPPDPRTTFRAPPNGRPSVMVRPRKPEAERRTHAGRPNGEPERARPGLGRRCRTAQRPGGRATGPPAPRSGARHPSGTDCWLGVTPQRRGDGAVRLHPPRRQSRFCRDGGHSQPRPGSADRRPGSAGRGATASAPATCATRAVSGRTAISCPATPKVSRTRRTCHQHPHSALKTGPPAAGSNATTGRTLEVETPSGYAFASATTLWRTRPPICGR